MALQCKFGYNKYKSPIEFKLYEKDCLFELNEEQIKKEIPVVKEYEPFEVILTSKSEEDYFVLPELEDYDIYGRENNRFYSNNVFEIYKPSWKKEVVDEEIQDVALAPGYYTIVVHLDEKAFFAYFCIAPKDLSYLEWRLMASEVENKVKGLAVEYVASMRNKSKKMKLGTQNFNLDDDILFLSGKVSRICYALETIKEEAKYKIKKHYFWTPAGAENEIDYETFRKIGERHDKQSMLYTPKRYLEYDVDENRWLKFFIQKIAKFCYQKEQYLDDIINQYKNDYEEISKYFPKRAKSEINYEYKSRERTFNDLRDISDNLVKLRHYLNEFLKSNFIKSVSEPNSIIFPKSLMLNPSYNIIYKIYTYLFKNDSDFSLDPFYKKYWKKTPQLYEIWCYVEVLNSLIELGYEPVSGWIYNNKKVLPFLQDNTRVILVGNEIQINLTYNQKIFSKKEQVTYAEPLYTFSKRNKPDIRIDIFGKPKRFFGSIILDSKYKRLGNILKKNHGNFLDEQFRAYAVEPFSPLFKPKIFENKLRVVDSVLVMYPRLGAQDVLAEATKYNSNNVFMIQLRPGNGQDELRTRLESRIDELRKMGEVFK